MEIEEAMVADIMTPAFLVFAAIINSALFLSVFILSSLPRWLSIPAGFLAGIGFTGAAFYLFFMPAYLGGAQPTPFLSMLCVLSAFLLTLLVRSRLRRRSLPATLGIFLIGITVAVIGVKLFQLKEIARIEGLATSEERLTRKMSWNNKQVTLHVPAAFLSGPNERAGQLPGSLMISIEYPELLPRALSAKSKRSEEIIVFFDSLCGPGVAESAPSSNSGYTVSCGSHDYCLARRCCHEVSCRGGECRTILCSGAESLLFHSRLLREFPKMSASIDALIESLKAEP
ncbi:MAG: hypothetical protein WAK07_00420 [Rhodomicrobium sp.]